MTRIPATKGVRRREESGFALLVIFLIAAAVAFTMYQELPRAAFESARDKEQLLMDRGNQYKRAIQLFYAVNQRYPSEIKDLENTNEKRYLRRRYIDPMTGKDEWRLVHTNGSFLTDSLVTKPPTQNASNGLPGAGQTPGGGPLGSNNMNTSPAATTSASGTANAAANPAANPNDPNAPAVPAPLNAAAQRRPSDRLFPTGPGFPQPPGALTPGNGANPANFNPDDPSTWPAITLAPPTAQSGQAQQGVAQRPGQNNLGQLAGQGGLNPQQLTLGNTNPFAQNGLVTAQVPDPSAQANAAQNTIVPNVNPLSNPVNAQPTPQPQQAFNGNSPFPNQFGNQANNLAAAGFNPQNPTPPQAAVTTGQSNLALPGSGASGNTADNTSSKFSNAALTSIDNSLFRPNQAPTAGPTGSAGIAGVASTFKGPSIKAYKERTKYQEWEFVYEPAVNQPGAPGQAGANSPGANPLGQAGAQGQNSTGANPGAPATGQAPAQGSSNPFSQTNIFGPQAPTQ